MRSCKSSVMPRSLLNAALRPATSACMFCSGDPEGMSLLHDWATQDERTGNLFPTTEKSRPRQSGRLLFLRQCLRCHLCATVLLLHAEAVHASLVPSTMFDRQHTAVCSMHVHMAVNACVTEDQTRQLYAHALALVYA